MAFSLQFSPEFFIGPHDTDGSPAPEGNPTSVLQALRAMPEDEWNEMAREVFDCEPEFLTPETVLEKIQETDTCRDLRSPVEVYIDDEGYHSVLVYDGER